MGEIVDYRQLAQHIGCSTAQVRKIWRRLPHFFISMRGRDLRSARFDVDEVMAHLKQRGAPSGRYDRSTFD